MEVGETLNLSVDLSEPKAYFHTVGRVVWSDPRGRTGVRFQKTAPEDAVQLREWLFANASSETSPEDQPCSPVEAPASVASFAQMLEENPQEEVKSPFRTYVSGLLATEAVKEEVESLASDLDSALQIVVQRAFSLTRASGAAIALSDGGEMICRATLGDDAPPLGTRLQIGSGFSGECVRSGQLLHCDDSELDDRVDRESCRALNLRSIMAAPIRSSQSVIGLIEIFSPNSGAFGEGDKTVLQGMAEIVLGAIQRSIQGVIPAPVVPLEPSPRDEIVQRIEASQGASQTISKSTSENVVCPMAETNVPNTGPEGAKMPPPSRRRLLWIFVAVLVVAILIVLGVVVAGSAEGAANVPRHLAERNPDLARQARLEGNSLEELRKLASQGDTLAQFTLGLRYATGSDVAQDYTEAVRWFSSAADQGHVLAQSTLGAYYWAGRGVPQDLRKAYFWALLAQSGGDDASRARVPFLVSRLTRVDLLEIQQQADDWMKQHRLQGKPSPARK